jgi:hypothetical protein
MRYTSPRIMTTSTATSLIQSRVAFKNIDNLRDANPPNLDNATPQAYEADE